MVVSKILYIDCFMIDFFSAVMIASIYMTMLLMKSMYSIFASDSHYIFCICWFSIFYNVLRKKRFDRFGEKDRD